MRVGSLCSGAGGLDIAVEQVFGARTVWHSELTKLKQKDGILPPPPPLTEVA